MFIIDLVILFAAVCVLAYVRATRVVWTSAMAAILLFSSVFGWLHPLALVIGWIVFLAAAAFANLSTLRRNFFTRAFIKEFRKVLPPMSDTEREALEAGNVWWEAELFQGKPNWKTLLKYPKPELTDEEQAFLDNQVDTLCDMLKDWDTIREARMPDKVWDYIQKERFFSMIIPKEYGGLEFSALMQSTVVLRLASRSLSAAITAMVPNSLGPAELLLHYGTEEQKNYYLPRLAAGQEIPCFALTSTEGGSDAGGMPDTGVVCKGMHEGKEVLGIKLNFDKRYITLAPKSTLLGLAFKMYDPDHLMGDKEDIGITCALIPSDHPGVDVSRRHFPLYLAFQNGPVRGKDVFIPLDWIIGGPKMAGCGWRMLMECLSAGRGISLPALSGAAGKHCYRMTGAYAKLRKQFGVSIGKFEGVQETMADIAGKAYIIEAARRMTAGAIDLGVKPSLASAIAKYHMTEMCRKVSDDALDIHAGRGIQTGPRNYMANMYLSIPVAITVEGANILTRNLMIFGQGAVRCHPYIFAEMQALSDPDLSKSLKDFDNLLINHIGYGMSNFARSLFLGLSFGSLASAPVSGPTAKYYKQMTRLSSGLALMSDVAMLVLGGDLKRKESISARLGDVLSYLYLGSAVLKYYQDYGCKKEDLVHVHWAMQDCLYKAQEAFYGVFKNFPNKVLGRVLKYVIFPFGRSYSKPADDLSHKMAEMMMEDSEFRDRLTNHTFIGKTADDPTGRVEMAFQTMLKLEPVLKRVRQAGRDGVIPRKGEWHMRLAEAVKASVISKEEEKQLKAFEIARIDALEVDDFAPEELVREKAGQPMAATVKKTKKKPEVKIQTTTHVEEQASESGE